MNRSGWVVAATVGVVMVFGCGSGSGTNAGTAGTTGSAGRGGAAGASGAGGGAGATGAGGTSAAAGTTGAAGTAGAAGATGAAGAMGAGGAAGGAGPKCRTYATAYTFDATTGAHYSYTCTHSETAGGFDCVCNMSSTTDTDHWASKSDFIDEAATLGVQLLTSSMRMNPNYLTTYEYDAQRRLQKIISGGSLYATFDDWDALGRRRHGVLAGACGGVEQAITYGASTITYDVLTGPCKQRLVSSFDADGIATAVDYGDGTTATYTTTAKATVCR